MFDRVKLYKKRLVNDERDVEIKTNKSHKQKKKKRKRNIENNNRNTMQIAQVIARKKNQKY